MTTRNVKFTAAVVTVTLFSLVLSACTFGQEKISRADLVGQWRSASDATLALTADGSLTIDNIPEDVWNPADWDPTNTTDQPKGPSIDAVGSWELVDGIEGISGQVIEVTSSSGAISYLLIHQRSPLSVSFILGDPDNHHFYEFTRIGSR